MMREARALPGREYASNWRLRLGIAGCALALALGRWAFAPLAVAQDGKPAAPSVRNAIGMPIEAALAALKQKHGKEALARIAEADATKDKTPYETYVVERIRAQALVLLGDAAGAASAFEKAVSSSGAPAADKLPLLAAATSQYFAAKAYAKTVELADRYVRDGGTEKSVRTLLIHSLYLGNDFVRATKEIAADVQSEEQAGRIPSEEQLQLLANTTLKQRDNAGYAQVLEKLLAYHPKKDYWLGVIHGVQTHAGFPGRLTLDLARLKIATGTMRSANEYVEAAQLSLQEGFPAEAGRIIDQGYAARLLGTGAEAERHKRLRAMATKNLAEDRRTAAQDDAQAAAATNGVALFNAGFNHVFKGSFDKGLDMMERGLGKGGLKRADDSRLHLGYAFYLAGRQQKAAETFKAVQGQNGAAALARLWVIHIGHKAPPRPRS